MSLTSMTELDAVNIALSTIGESPINSLAEASLVVDATTARAVLNEVSSTVQETGWTFNTEKGVTLSPDLISKEIAVPPNCVQIDASGKDQGRLVVVRGSRLYDKDNRSYQFSSNIVTDMIMLLGFDELPQAARYYIAIRAARIFQARMVGSQTLGGFTEKDELQARVGMGKFEAVNGNYNILNGSWSVARVLGR